MEPSPEAWKELEDLCVAFDEAYVNLVQATRRLRRIHEIKTVRQEKKPFSPAGHFCPRCQSQRLDNKGGGCLRCLDCKFELGCNG